VGSSCYAQNLQVGEEEAIVFMLQGLAAIIGLHPVDGSRINVIDRGTALSLQSSLIYIDL
jgi:hypothetical protein